MGSQRREFTPGRWPRARCAWARHRGSRSADGSRSAPDSRPCTIADPDGVRDVGPTARHDSGRHVRLGGIRPGQRERGRPTADRTDRNRRPARRHRARRNGSTGWCAQRPAGSRSAPPVAPLRPAARRRGRRAAARVYRRCRNAGITPRGMIDCLIASVAWRRGAALLAHDADLNRVARVIGIDLDKASLRA